MSDRLRDIAGTRVRKGKGKLHMQAGNTGTVLTQLSIGAAGRLIARRALSPVELTEAYLAQIARLNARLNAYVRVLGDEARAAAQAAEDAIMHGSYHGPLHGIPIALKDLYDMAGVPTEAGSKIRRGHMAETDATVTRKLRAAGAVLLGKTNTHEFAFGVTTNNPHTGPTRNPWDDTRFPGGSSGGSGAAVAAGMAAMAMGTDTGGSIRIPASLCGVVGLKPTHGRISLAGVVPLAWSLDHAGPLTRTVEDAALVLNLLAGADDADAATVPVPVPDYPATLGAGVRGLRLGVPRDGFFVDLDPEVAAATEVALAVLRDLGATVEEVTFPSLTTWWEAQSDILLAEARHYHAEWLRTRPDDYGDDVRARLTRRDDLTAAELVHALRVRAAATRDLMAVFTQYDALVMPTTRLPAAPIDGQTVMVNGQPVFAPNVLTLNVNPFNLTGMPAVSVPGGFTESGLPIGLQVVTRRWDEATALRVAAAYERATNWHTRVPVLEAAM